MFNIPSISYFNSIKVRLELSNDLLGTAVAVLFQFHKGTIRTAVTDGTYTNDPISIP